MYHGGDSVSQSNEPTPRPPLPAAPDPACDSGADVRASSQRRDSDEIPSAADLDIFTLSPIAALKLLCRSIDALVRITGDVPPTPPISRPLTPVRLAATGQQTRGGSEQGQECTTATARESEEGVAANPRPHTPPLSRGSEDNNIEGVTFRRTSSIGSPEATPTPQGFSVTTNIIGADAETVEIQQGAIARKFYSKHPPPISLFDYLMRLHRFCPMSTAVYLASSFYVHKLAVEEKSISVTGRNVHRLMLGGLRVAMKALEDLTYSHSRFAKVGGVSERELGRLEISFCFLTGFSLKVDPEMLQEHARILERSQSMLDVPPAGFTPRLPPLRARKQAQAQAQEIVTAV